ncbi:hypothetical protein [Streptomyces sp. NPDC047981]|uniref:hypothetical protein n=1 Tax=Streptomyces sp. NPDC047981 TaxID=3154610 RepID=UPI0034396DBC
MESSVHRWRRGLVAAAAALLLGTGAVACAGNAEPTTTQDTPQADGPTETTGSGTQTDTGTAVEDDGVIYAACMRKNGVDVADPKPGEAPRLPEQVSESVLDKAEKECGKAPGAQQQQAGSGGLASDEKYQELALREQQCLRENGYVVPETTETAQMPKMPGEDPVLDRAIAACKETGDALREYLDKVMGEK